MNHIPLLRFISKSSTRKNKDSQSTIQESRGKLGEDIAESYLAKQTSFKILFRNWRKGRYEIDIICEDEKSVLVFVEVRAREAAALVSGYASITAKKKHSMRKAAYAYLRTLKKRPQTYRYDVIELEMKGAKALAIRHYRNVRVF